MKIKVWRVVKAKYAKEAYSGKGACDYGGRWNSEGVFMVYTSESLALAVLEILVGGIPLLLLESYVKISAQIEVSEITEPKSLPVDWDETPAGEGTKKIGDKWIKSEDSAVLKVPSVVVPEESNYLINPFHKNVSRIIVGNPEKLKIDKRLIK